MPNPSPRPDDPIESWKTRYFQALDAIDRRERHWTEVQRLLRRAVGRLGVMAAEGYPALREPVERLQVVLRDSGDEPALTTALSELGEAAMRAASSRPDAVAPAPQAPSSTPPAAHDVLLALLERIDLPEVDATTLSVLRARLGRPVRPGELPGVLAAFAELITQLRKSLEDQRRGLESFLQEVSEKLSELDASLDRSAETRRDALRDSQALQTQVQEEMSSIQMSVESATDIDGLKRTVYQGLATVQGHVARHLESAQRRDQEAEEQIGLMGERLRRLEVESERLRRQARRARDQAVRDSLTGLYNRLAYEERAAQAYGHWKRYGDPLSLLVVDVDHFKQVNDRFGHAAGDRALKALAERLAGNVREADFLARYGGEEFVVLMPKTDRTAAATAAEKLRALVETCPFQYREARVPITVSCGVAEFLPGDTAEQVFDRADRALYRAKQAGRNRCEVG
jgi:diguanylate cyclase